MGGMRLIPGLIDEYTPTVQRGVDVNAADEAGLRDCGFTLFFATQGVRRSPPAC